MAPDGDDSSPGSRAEPLATIQAGLDRAQPGETVFVTAGDYQESEGLWQSTVTVRDGSPEAPITITGPEDAVLRPVEEGAALRIKHSHIHLRGLTFDGLLDPDRPNDPASYASGPLILTIPFDGDPDIEDLVLAPAAIGNSRRALMLVQRSANVEIGPTRIIGLAGADYVLGDEETHVGEIIYLGQPHLRGFPEGYPWDTLDYTRHVHVHHIDNSAGHPHSELVNAKTGTHDVLVEYCSSYGGAQNKDDTPSAEIRFENSDSTLRWCDLRDGQNSGVHVWESLDEPISPERDPRRISERVGRGVSIHGNALRDFDEMAVRVPRYDENTVCGNEITGPPGTATGDACPSDVPEGDGIGHLGGESPWA